MIQRIQTLYLLLVTILGMCTALFPSVEFYTTDITSEAHYTLQCIFLKGVAESCTPIIAWLLFIIAIIIPLLAFVTIFLYKKRPLQISLTIANIILMLGYYVILIIAIWNIKNTLNATWHLHITTSLPLVNVILSFLALRGITKDEALIRSLNRIR